MFGLFTRRGFSLVEIAIVLVVIGLIISGGLLGLSPLLQSSRSTQTNAQMDKIDQALLVYVIQNGCLPCPALPTALTGQATDGGGAYSSGCGHASQCAPTQGIVPWVNLGLAENDTIDAYGSFIDYAVSSGAASGLNYSSTSMVRTAPSTYPAGTLLVQTIAEFAGGDTTCATPTDCQTSAAAYVLMSHGADLSYGYVPSTGKQNVDPNGSALQAANRFIAGRTTAFVDDKSQARTGATTATSYFDDIVRFKTAPVIIQSCGSDACGNPA